MQNDPLIIFTDLDGTLLDLHSYSYEGTESALSKIQKRNIPLIFCSSKTRTEQEFYQRELGIDHPFIVENGGAIFIRKDYFRFEYEHQKSNATYHVIEIGMSYKMIREKLTKIKNENGFKFNGYGDMSVDEVSALTGLDWEAAQRAMTREYSETINYVDSAEELHKLKLALQRQELQCSHGGRLQTVTATSNDKGKAVRILKNMYHKAFGSINTAGIGDAMNDLPFLSEVEYPILMQRPQETWPVLSLPNLRKIPGSGPEVWSRIISELLDSEAAAMKFPNVK